MEETNGDKAAANGKGWGFMTGLVSGAIAGGAAALMFTPLKGEEVRGRGREKAPELWEATAGQRAAAQAAFQKMSGFPAGDVLTRVKEALSALRERLREAIEEGKEGITEGEEEAQHRYEGLVKRRRRGSSLR
jgi:gas vesicle protein